MKQKSKKSALLLSFTSLLICFAMLVGSTFAWFTDTATTGVNKIQAGNLDVDIVDKEGNSLDGQSLSFRDANGKTDILWEPGATFNLDSFKIVNKGNLAFKYKAVISGVNGNAKLLEAIDFFVEIGDAGKVALADWEGVLLPKGKTATAGTKEEVEETSLITISGTMKEKAGNEYQNLSADGIGITVYATQYTYEYDSENNEYDKTAEFPIGKGTKDDPYQIHNALMLSAIKNNGTYTYYKVADGVTEIDCSNVSWLDLYGEFDGNGVTLNNLKKSLFHNVGNGKNGDDEATVLKNFTAVMNTPNSLVFNIAGPNTKFENVKVSGYMEGLWNMGAFVNYGSKNSDGVGFDYTVEFVKCSCDATIISKQNSSAAVLVGHTYPGAGKATIKLDKATDTGIKDAKMRINGSINGYKYYGVGVGNEEVYLDEAKVSNAKLPAENVSQLERTTPTKNEAEGNYTVSVAEGATAKAQLTAQLTSYNEDGSVNLRGITFTLGASTPVKNGIVFGKIESIEIINEKTESDRPEYELEGTILKVYTNTTENYLTGTVSVTVSQYDASNELCAIGSLTLAEKKNTSDMWTIK